MIHHKGWDIDEDRNTGRFKDGKPIIAATLRNGLNDIEPDGSFVPCDMDIEAVTDGVTTHRVKRGRYGELRFADTDSTNKHLCKIKYKDGKGLSFKYLGGDSGLPDVGNGKPSFVSNNGVTIEHTPTYKGVRIELVINDPLTAPAEHSFSMKTYGQAHTFIEQGGGLVAIGEDGKTITIQAPYAIDANGEEGQVTMVLDGVVNNLQTFKKVVDEAWLKQAVAPVRIDPNITIEDGVDGGIIEDALMAAAGLTSNYGARVNMNNNNYSGSNNQSWVIRTALTGLGIGTVTLAKYLLNADLIGAGGGGYACELRQILRDWNEGNKTGSAASTGEVTAGSARHNEESWTTSCARGAGTDYDSVDITANFNMPTSTGAYEITLDNTIIQARVDGGTNNGDVCHAVTESSDDNVRTETSESSNKPQMYIEYTDGVVFSGFPFFFDGGHY